MSRATRRNPPVRRNDQWLNVKDYGAKGDGVTDDTAAINAVFASLPASSATIVGATVYFPNGTYLCNTVTSGVVLLLLNKPHIKIQGSTGARIQTTTAVATELLRVDGCDNFSMDHLRLDVRSTAQITYALHITVAAGGFAHYPKFNKVFINGQLTERRAWDAITTNGSPVVYTAATGQTDTQTGSPWVSSQFAAGDVGGLVTINIPGVNMFTSVVQSVQQYTATLASDINASTLSIPLTAPLSPTAPAGNFVVNIDNELFFVISGGTTSTLTCSSRGRGLVYPAASHTAGATVSFSSATLADNTTGTVSNAVAPIRIMPGSSGWMLYGFAVGADHPGAVNMDLAEITFDHCHVEGAAAAAWHLGNGQSANVLNLHAYSCSAARSGATVQMNGCNMSWHGGGTGTNLAFFKRTHPGQQEIEIHGVRCDGAAVFWESAQGSAADHGPAVALRAIEMLAHNATDWNVINHQTSTPLTLENVKIHGPLGIPVQFITRGTSTSPCYVVAINVSTSGGANPFVTNDSTVVRYIVPGPKETPPTYATTVDTVGGVLMDGRLQVRGGLARKRTTVADANYTVLASDMVVAYTSLAAARVITLPASSTLPSVTTSGVCEFTIRDESGSCDGTKTITITPPSGQIEASGALASTLVLNAAFARATVYWNGTNWLQR